MSSGELELRQLRVLLAVVDAAGYSRGATALGLSQSTVSESMASLERTVGARLLSRQGRKVVPTEAGRVLVAYARKLVALAAEATATTALAGDRSRPPLVIGANDSIGSYLLPAALASLRAKHPHAHATIRTGQCDEIRAWLESGKIEIGLLTEPAGARPTPHAAALIGHSPLVMCSRPRTVGVGAQELRRFTVHMDVQGGFYQSALRTCLRRAGAPTPDVNAAGSIEGVKRTVLSSEDALGVLPAFVIAAEVARGEIQILKLDPPLPDLRLRAVWQGGKAAEPRALVTDLLAQLRDALAARFTRSDGRRLPGGAARRGA